jgi:hypothetical protein
MSLRNIGDRLYTVLPRSRRGVLYRRIMSNPEFPFHDDANDSAAGRWFVVATGNHEAPAAQLSLSKIIDEVSRHMNYTEEQKEVMFKVYVEEIEKINGVLKNRARNIQSMMATLGRRNIQGKTNTPRNNNRPSNVPSNILSTIGSFLSGYSGNVKTQELRLREKNSRNGPGVGGRRTRRLKRSRSRKGAPN